LVQAAPATISSSSQRDLRHKPLGAATAIALARRGCAVLCTYLRLQDEADPGAPQAYRDHRAEAADAVIAQRRQFSVDAMAVAVLIGEFARRHVARGATWGRIIGLTSGDGLGFPEEVLRSSRTCRQPGRRCRGYRLSRLG
jgi:hypothetical protein